MRNSAKVIMKRTRDGCVIKLGFEVEKIKNMARYKIISFILFSVKLGSVFEWLNPNPTQTSSVSVRFVCFGFSFFRISSIRLRFSDWPQYP